MTTLGNILVSVLGAVFPNGFWPGKAPDNQPAPFGVYLHFGPVNMFLAGRGGDQNQRVQIDVYHNTYLEAAQLADLLDAQMDTQSIDFSPSTFTSTPLSREYFGVDDDTQLHRFLLEYSVWFRPGDSAPVALEGGGFLLLE